MIFLFSMADRMFTTTLFQRNKFVCGYGFPHTHYFLEDEKMALFKKEKFTVYIDGMSCMHCASRVEKAFLEIGLKAKVDLSKKCAYVKSKTEPNEELIWSTISALGFTPVKIEK